MSSMICCHWKQPVVVPHVLLETLYVMTVHHSHKAALVQLTSLNFDGIVLMGEIEIFHHYSQSFYQKDNGTKSGTIQFAETTTHHVLLKLKS